MKLKKLNYLYEVLKRNRGAGYTTAIISTGATILVPRLKDKDNLNLDKYLTPNMRMEGLDRGEVVIPDNSYLLEMIIETFEEIENYKTSLKGLSRTLKDLSSEIDTYHFGEGESK